LTQYEKYWLKVWNERRIFESESVPGRKKVFVTFPFPYMNGPLHIGHCFTATRVDIYARFKRMQGYNVLFPWAWHWTGESIPGMSYRLSQGDKEVRKAFLEIDGVPESEVERFVDPEYLASYYTRVSREAVKDTGFSIDWRREFRTVDPAFKKFIEWQYLRLRELGYVVQGTHPVVWCRRDESPTGDHDRMEGEGVSPEEFNLLKFEVEGDKRKRFLVAGTPASHGQWVAAFVQRLSELGWIEGRTVAIAYRWAEGHSERYAEIAAEFVRLKVDVIVTTGPAVPAAMQATSVIPVVFALAGDPVGTGLIASLARPGGNVTGLSIQQIDLASKRLELLREIVPGLRRLAIMANIGFPDAVLEMREVQSTAKMLGLEIVALAIRQAEDIAPAFESLKGPVDALYVCADPIVSTNRIRINTSALGARLPTMHGFRDYVEVGGLMSYGPNNANLFRRAAEYVDKILKGAKPGDLPVEQPTKFDLIINLKTAKALGLTVLPSLLARADEIIE